MALTVVKLGGSIAFPSKPDMKVLDSFAKQFRAIGGQKAVVVGGGAAARTYVTALRGRCNEAFLDEVGILVANLNARIVAELIDGVFVKNLEEARRAVIGGKIPVLGGLTPGHSTDAVAALLAERLNASQLFVLTDVNGIYDSDPKKNPKAKLLKSITFAELSRLCSTLDYAAANYPVFDPIAAKIVARSKIPTIICNGHEPWTKGNGTRVI